MPIALIALCAFIVTIVVWNVVFKRNMGEAMILGFLVTLAFAGGSAPSMALKAITEAASSDILFAAAGFVFMTYFIDHTGVMSKLVNILSSAVGRLRGGPAIVDAITSGVMGALVGGSNTANAAASGSITGPWMLNSGFTKERAATIIAGNAGLGAAIPPSASMIIMLGFAGSLVTTSQIYLALMVAGLYQVVHRLIITAVFVHKDKLPYAESSELQPLAVSLRTGWPSLTLALGALIPILVTVGPISSFLASTSLGESLEDISLIVWIPVLMFFITLIVGRNELPHNTRAWYQFLEGSLPKFYTILVLLFFAIAASEALAELGLEEDIKGIIEKLDLSPLLLIICIGVFLVVIAGPLSSTATLSAVGQVSFSVLIGAGINPVLAVIAILVFASTEGASPPASGSIFVASGITGAKPESTFVPLIGYYVVPIFLIGVLVGVGILPVPH